MSDERYSPALVSNKDFFGRRLLFSEFPGFKLSRVLEIWRRRRSESQENAMEPSKIQSFMLDSAGFNAKMPENDSLHSVVSVPAPRTMYNGYTVPGSFGDISLKKSFFVKTALRWFYLFPKPRFRRWCSMVGSSNKCRKKVARALLVRHKTMAHYCQCMGHISFVINGPMWLIICFHIIMSLVIVIRTYLHTRTILNANAIWVAMQYPDVRFKVSTPLRRGYGRYYEICCMK
jgi:hypothetical protein